MPMTASPRMIRVFVSSTTFDNTGKLHYPPRTELILKRMLKILFTIGRETGQEPRT